jgi:hypothetical protein
MNESYFFSENVYMRLLLYADAESLKITAYIENV